MRSSGSHSRKDPPWRPPTSGPPSPWPVPSASTATTPPGRTSGTTPTGSSSRSTAAGAAGTPPTGRPADPVMPLNQALVGKAHPAVAYEVGREKLREFAVAVGETDPIYHDESAARAAGHPDLPAVPNLAVVLSLRAGQVVYGDPELGLDYSRVVHGEQEFVYHRPIRAGDRLLAAGKVAAAQPHGRPEPLPLETGVTSEDRGPGGPR